MTPTFPTRRSTCLWRRRGPGGAGRQPATRRRDLARDRHVGRRRRPADGGLPRGPLCRAARPRAGDRGTGGSLTPTARNVFGSPFYMLCLRTLYFFFLFLFLSLLFPPFPFFTLLSSSLFFPSFFPFSSFFFFFFFFFSFFF